MPAGLLRRRAIAAGAFALLVAACAPRGPVVVEATPARGGEATQPPLDTTPPLTRTDARAAVWRVYAREHVDLWLHGFAMLQGDSTLVPYFRIGYRDELTRVRRERAVTTSLDANRDRLASYLAANPRLISAQFIPLYFETWDALRAGFELFLRANGDPRYGRDAYSARVIATFAASFTSRQDREWAQTFVQALDDERSRFYSAYWLSETRAREGTRSVFERMWQDTYRARLRPFFVNAQQDDGEILLSLTLGGEGRTVGVSRRENYVAVTYPAREDQAAEALYVLVHELAGNPAGTAIRDHTTPAEQRDGTSDRYSSLGAVRGGAIMLARIAPELVAGYQRYYLGVARQTPGSGDPASAFERVFALPDAIRDAIARQIDIILGGI